MSIVVELSIAHLAYSSADRRVVDFVAFDCRSQEKAAHRPTRCRRCSKRCQRMPKTAAIIPEMSAVEESPHHGVKIFPRKSVDEQRTPVILRAL
jgi:hypothetical protein